MEQVIKINVPEGKKAVYNESSKTIEFVDIEPIRSRSWEEFCKNHPQISYEYYLQQSQIMFIPPTTETRIDFRHTSCGGQSKCLLESKEDAEGILALIQLTRLHDEWVGNWNIKERITEHKGFYSIKIIVFNINYGFELKVLEKYTEQSLLCFPTKEMAEEFLNCFRSLIITAKKFI